MVCFLKVPKVMDLRCCYILAGSTDKISSNTGMTASVSNNVSFHSLRMGIIASCVLFVHTVLTVHFSRIRAICCSCVQCACAYCVECSFLEESSHLFMCGSWIKCCLMYLQGYGHMAMSGIGQPALQGC